VKAIVCRTYGSPEVLRLEDVAVPTPDADQVLLRVRAASLNPYDWHFMRGSPFMIRMLSGLTKPKDTRVGVDVAGVVDAIGSRVTRFKPGDEVFGGCRGAFAEYACAAETALAMKPASVTFEQAAAVPVAGYTALQALRDHGRIERGQSVLVNGAAGGVGTFAVQFAKAFGAHVDGVCSTRNIDLVCALGADRAIDYTREDFTKSSERYDIVVDCHASGSLVAGVRVLAPGGRYVIVGAPGRGVMGPLWPAVKALVLAPLMRRRLTMMMAKPNRDDLALIADWMEAGTVTPALDRRYRLDEASEAIRYLEQGHARGKVVLTVP
jgi:NADPH:quinone reductase-like Zn-dependent oxidoreductase